MFGTSYGSGAAPGGSPNPNNDSEVSQPPTDGISSVRFSPAANHMAATSWDTSVRVWEVSPGQWGTSSVQSVPKAMTNHNQPVLCSAWSTDGSTVFFGATDGQVKMWNLSTNQAQQVGQHNGGVRHMYFIGDHNLLATGSWDATVKYWDCRSPNPALSFSLAEKCYAMDVLESLMVVGVGNKNLQIFDLRNPSVVMKQMTSPLKWQTRCVACFLDKTGFFLGSIEGRVAVQNLDDNATGAFSPVQKTFTFKCHRQNNAEVYAVNSIAVHPQYGTFVTAGSDGCYHFWDKDSKKRLRAMERCNQSISCAAFNRDGTLYAYAVSYDWSRGAQFYNPTTDKNTILLHAVQDGDVKPQKRR